MIQFWPRRGTLYRFRTRSGRCDLRFGRMVGSGSPARRSGSTRTSPAKQPLLGTASPGGHTVLETMLSSLPELRRCEGPWPDGSISGAKRLPHCEGPGQRGGPESGRFGHVFEKAPPVGFEPTHTAPEAASDYQRSALATRANAGPAFGHRGDCSANIPDHGSTFEADGTGRPLSFDESLHRLGVAGALHADGGRRGFARAEFEVGGGEVFLEPGELRVAPEPPAAPSRTVRPPRAQVALAWLLAQKLWIVPIPGRPTWTPMARPSS